MILKESPQSGLVGIWWYTEDGEMWCKSVDLDSGYNDGNFIHYSSKENHMSQWRNIVKDNISDINKQNEIISKGYKSLERGRVVFNLRTQSYEIICSSTLSTDIDFINKCINEFNLSGCRRSVIPLQHYVKMELTGNPAIDAFYYEVDI